MINKLKLSGNKLIVYAIIYGFSQDRENYFSGSLNYLCRSTQSSKPTVIKILKELLSNQLITKRIQVVNGVTFNKYAICEGGSKESLPLVNNFNGGSKESLPGGSKESLPNNTITNNTNNNKEFSFYNSLKLIGIEDELIKDWLKVRKTKKATNSKTAFNLFMNQVKSSNKPLEEILKLCIQNDWKSFNSSWLKDEKAINTKKIQMRGY